MEHTITTTKQQDQTVKGILKNANLLSIPILGAANAGPAMVFANSNIEGYLRVSSTLIERPRLTHRLFALKVDGPIHEHGVRRRKKN